MEGLVLRSIYLIPLKIAIKFMGNKILRIGVSDVGVHTLFLTHGLMKKILLISCLFLQNCVIRLPSDGQTNDTNDMVFVTAYERGGNGAHPMPNDGSKLEGNRLKVLMMSDLINYDVVNHRAYISESAMNKIDKAMANFAALIVWAGQDAIYAGEFYSPVQSGTAPGVVIVPTIDDDNKPCLAIELGYPSRAFYKGMEDVRSDKKLMEWLRQCNKIRGE